MPADHATDNSRRPPRIINMTCPRSDHISPAIAPEVVGPGHTGERI